MKNGLWEGFHFPGDTSYDARTVTGQPMLFFWGGLFLSLSGKFAACRPIKVAITTFVDFFESFAIELRTQLRVADLIPMQLSVECSCCGVPSGCECETSHLSHFSQNESLVYSTQLHYFHKMQNTAFIPSQDTQERITHESLLRLLT